MHYPGYRRARGDGVWLFFMRRGSGQREAVYSESFFYKFGEYRDEIERLFILRSQMLLVFPGWQSKRCCGGGCVVEVMSN